MTGLAPDGGLYVPAEFPLLETQNWSRLMQGSFNDIAVELLRPFVAGSLREEELLELTDEAWRAFRTDAVSPLHTYGDLHLLELFHGPTLAFKDVALQLLGRLFDRFLARSGRQATVLGATSGDTGSAAIAGCRGRSQLDIVILHPHGRTSDVQRRQMTTVRDENVVNLAVRGHFDDCQALVKSLFRDATGRERYGLTAVNSINIARVLAQMVYYVYACGRLGATPHRRIDFCVPTGNFGDVLAGHWARRVGAPIGRLIIATNHNDILARTLQSGRYEVDTVRPSLSPSMDIQVSSNFERLLFELVEDDPRLVETSMAKLRAEGGFELGARAMSALRAGFAAGSCSDEDALAEIKRVYQTSGTVLDPHTAVASKVARQHRGEAPMVVLATAHPAKFPGAVQRAIGRPPPPAEPLAALDAREERFEVIDASEDAVRDVLERVLRTRRA